MTACGRSLRYLICPDSFKGSLSSPDMCDALARGIRNRLGDVGVRQSDAGVRQSDAGVIRRMPLADGGEGTAEAISAALGGTRVVVDTVDPFGDPIEAAYEVVGDKSLAVIDMAAATALAFSKARGDFALGGIMKASTYGTGLMIRHALSQGYRNIIVGLGGSATNDGGIGAAQALGMKFFASDGVLLDARRGAAVLSEIASVSDADLAPELAHCTLTLLYDVDIPLIGEHGCSVNFAPQKGASVDEVAELDAAMAGFASAAASSLGRDLSAKNGAGAAGGLGFGLSLCGGQLRFGAPFVLDVCGFDEAARDSDVIITGEGCCDAQTASGKLPSWVARRAKSAGDAAVVCVCGADRAVGELYSLGMDAVFALADGPMSLEESSVHCAELAEKLAFNIAGLASAVCQIKR